MKNLLSNSIFAGMVIIGGLLLSSMQAMAQCSGVPAANTVCAGPPSGGSGFASYRALVGADIPGGGGIVSSIVNNDSTLTISPTTGAVIASINLTQSNNWTGAISLTINQNSITQITITNTTSGTAASAAIAVVNGAVSGGVIAASASYTSIPILAGGSFLLSNAGTAGIDTVGASAIIFGTSNTERGRILLGLMVGTTTDPGAGIINVLTGYRIGNAATTGHVLRGNGINYIDAQLAFSDLSGTCTTAQACLGLTAAAVGDIIFASATTPTWSRLADVAVGSVLVSGGTNTAPAWSASPTLTTSITSPLYIGGSTASSSLSLESTSGAGTSDKIQLLTGSQVVRATVDTNGKWLFGALAPASSNAPFVDINQNASSVVGVFNNVLLRVANADAATSIVEFDSPLGAVIAGYAPGGTLASPSATGNGVNIWFLQAYGFTNASYNTAQIVIQTAEAWSSTAGGSQIKFFTTPKTTVSSALAVEIQASGGLSVGTTTDPGIGSLQLNAQMFMPNITTTSAAQNGTVCWTTGTGKFTVDTTVGCLTSIGAAKNITERLSSGFALKMISLLNPVAFRYKDGYGDAGRYEQFGLIAEQVAAVDERMVGRDQNGTLTGVRYMELTSVLAGAIKELKAENDNLREELNDVRRKMSHRR